MLRSRFKGKIRLNFCSEQLKTISSNNVCCVCQIEANDLHHLKLNMSTLFRWRNKKFDSKPYPLWQLVIAVMKFFFSAEDETIWDSNANQLVSLQ